MSAVRAFGRFWYEFIVGDDWRIAAGVAVVLGLGAVAVAIGLTGPGLPIAALFGLVVIFVWPLLGE